MWYLPRAVYHTDSSALSECVNQLELAKASYSTIRKVLDRDRRSPWHKSVSREFRSTHQTRNVHDDVKLLNPHERKRKSFVLVTACPRISCNYTSRRRGQKNSSCKRPDRCTIAKNTPRHAFDHRICYLIRRSRMKLMVCNDEQLQWNVWKWRLIMDTMLHEISPS